MPLPHEPHPRSNIIQFLFVVPAVLPHPHHAALQPLLNTEPRRAAQQRSGVPFATCKPLNLTVIRRLAVGDTFDPDVCTAAIRESWPQPHNHTAGFATPDIGHQTHGVIDARRRQKTRTGSDRIFEIPDRVQLTELNVFRTAQHPADGQYNHLCYDSLYGLLV